MQILADATTGKGIFEQMKAPSHQGSIATFHNSPYGRQTGMNNFKISRCSVKVSTILTDK